jgi:hypothetical protein
VIKFKEHVRGVTHNLVANLIVVALAAVISWYTAHQAEVAGIPRYKAIVIGLSAATLVAVIFAAVSFGRAKRRTNDVSQDPPIRDPKLHENCERTISNHEATIRRLQNQNETHTIRVSAQDDQLKRLQGEVSDFSWLREIAAYQQHNIHPYIATYASVTDQSLVEEPLFIDFRFSLTSSAVYKLTATAITGSIRIGNRRLGHATPNKYPPRLETNELRDLTIGDTGYLTITQPLTRADAVFILNGGNDFMFDGLSIELSATPDIQRPIRLSPNDIVHNQEVRDKYPKLDIKFKRAVYFYISDRQKPGFPALVNFGITLDLTLENLRSTQIDIETVQVSLVNISQPTFRLQPDAGEIYERRYIDAQGILQVMGGPLRNLASFPITIIRRGKVSGCFQFTLEGVEIGAVKKGDTTASLVLTDKYGEHHAGNYDLDHFSAGENDST